MAKVKNGDTFSCSGCGLVLEVVDPCECADCGPICCDTPMEKSTSRSNSGGSTRRRKNSSAKRSRRSRR